MNKEQLTTLEGMETLCAKRAAKLVEEAGGTISFAAYDDAYAKIQFAPVPLQWAIVGSGLSPKERTQNQGVLCARKAVQLGLLVRNEKGYVLP